MSGKVTNTRKQALAIAALSTGATRKEAAGVAGVSERQLYRWLNEDATFIGKLGEAHRAEQERVAAEWRRAYKKAMSRKAGLGTLLVIKAYRRLRDLPEGKMSVREAILAARVGATLLGEAFAESPVALDHIPLPTDEQIREMSDTELAHWRAALMRETWAG